MTTETLPWDEIRLPDKDYNVRRVADSGAVPLFWGKDTDGHCVFMIEKIRRFECDPDKIGES